MSEEEEPKQLQSGNQVNSGVHGNCVELEAETLMNGGREVVIMHKGERYLLRITSKQKLLLTK